MHVLFTSVECFPVAKVGGLADVVGSLPKYLIKKNITTSVVMPAYAMPWFDGKQYAIQHRGFFHLGSEHLYFEVRYYIDDPLGFPLFAIHIPSKYDRFGVYAGKNGYYFGDELERHIAFQRAILLWLRDGAQKFDVVHCHDHHTGLIPFMLKYCYEFQNLSHIPSVFTIHNERYQGAMSWDKQYLLPHFDSWKSGMLDWNNTINPLASAIKCAYQVTTVSPNYLNELTHNSFGLESLFKSEYHKCHGILNGIDTDVWDPATDPMIANSFQGDIPLFKKSNKIALCTQAGLDASLPTYGFIGRLVYEKGAEFIAGIIDNWLSQGARMNFIILGTGDKGIEYSLNNVAQKYPKKVAVMMQYNEAIAHQIYAGADFLFMPSRVEPCGLNQMFAMRYGTLPIVRSTGGLKDTVIDIGDYGGVGIRFEQMSFGDMMHAIWRAHELYHQPLVMQEAQIRAMEIDNSWDNSANKYITLYQSI